MTLVLPSSARTAQAIESTPLLAPRLDDRSITALVADPLLHRRAGRLWWIALGVSGLFALVALVGFVHLVTTGIGILGNNTSVVWGFPIANYVWWIGIGNAGTLISSLLLLTRQKWRASINRFAEAMTLFAAAIAGLFPIVHLGRPMYAYWLAPYPNTMLLWPQWRSALVWDFWAILSYILFSAVFWYVGLIPDVATLRDRATRRGAQLFYGVLALGWTGSARQWHQHRRFHTTLAALAVPLVTSVHSIVGLDFAASLMPGWQESIFSPYFVVGAMFSGFAMVVVLATLIRWGLDLQDVITLRHFDGMAKILLLASIVMGLSYATEWFDAWYGSDAADRSTLAYEFTGPYWPLYIAMLACNVAAPQALWWPRVRANLWALALIAVLINVGMWLERILIIWNTLSHSFLPAMDRQFFPTIWDAAILIGPLGIFSGLFLLFVRVIPAVSMFEVREVHFEEQEADQDYPAQAGMPEHAQAGAPA